MPSLLRRRHLSYALRRGTWRHLGRRARALGARGGAPLPTALSWPVSDETRQTLLIRWPRRYGWANAGGWVDPIKRGIASHVRIEHAEIPQPAGNVVVFEALGEGTVCRVAIDYGDHLDLHECAAQADLYFKMQFSRDGYGSESIRPGGYVTKQPALYRHARTLRELRARRPPSHDVVGRFGMRWAREIRGKAIAMLESQDRFEFTGGAQAVWWGEYIDELSDARVCLDLPGNGELCYRLVECLALGACVIGPQLHAQMHVPLESGVHLIRIPRSLEGLIEWCERLLRDEHLRAELGRSAGEYFDRYLALEQLGAYYVENLWLGCIRH